MSLRAGTTVLLVATLAGALALSAEAVRVGPGAKPIALAAAQAAVAGAVREHVAAALGRSDRITLNTPLGEDGFARIRTQEYVLCRRAGPRVALCRWRSDVLRQVREAEPFELWIVCSGAATVRELPRRLVVDLRGVACVH
ncbi:MAG TPA: hypothetical protein VNJ53_04820 [Gaiellaceae bacterium]|nr:hypothetical protein [Gaiellaceae bacterium]